MEDMNTTREPSFDELSRENDALKDRLIRLDRVRYALEKALANQVDEIAELENQVDFYRKKYYEEHNRAERLLGDDDR